jgi:hypothetical protein
MAATDNLATIRSPSGTSLDEGAPRFRARQPSRLTGPPKSIDKSRSLEYTFCRDKVSVGENLVPKGGWPAFETGVGRNLGGEFTGGDFFTWIRRNPLKRPDSAKGNQGNPSLFAWISLDLLAGTRALVVRRWCRAAAAPEPRLFRERDRRVRKGLKIGQNISSPLWVFLPGERHLGA